MTGFRETCRAQRLPPEHIPPVLGDVVGQHGLSGGVEPSALGSFERYVEDHVTGRVQHGLLRDGCAGGGKVRQLLRPLEKRVCVDGGPQLRELVAGVGGRPVKNLCELTVNAGPCRCSGSHALGVFLSDGLV